MAANNTSAFNCRTVKGTTSWTEHAYERAIDMNPRLTHRCTPSGRIDPPNGAEYRRPRSRTTPGSSMTAMSWQAFAA